jgi:hypothetical protein
LRPSLDSRCASRLCAAGRLLEVFDASYAITRRGACRCLDDVCPHDLEITADQSGKDTRIR